MRMLSGVVLASLLAAGTSAALAQGVYNRPQLSAALANELVGDTVAICASRGYKVWAVVVNTDGVRIALLRGDGAPIHSQDNSYFKAYTASSLTLGRNESSTKVYATAQHDVRPGRHRDPQCRQADHRFHRCLRRTGRAVRRSLREGSAGEDPGQDQVTTRRRRKGKGERLLR
jgi:hypothetical protein